MRQPFLRVAALLLGSGLALSACGGAAPASTSPSPSPTSSQPSAKPSTSVAASASEKGPIKIGVDNPLTGASANTGKDNNDGFSLYLSSVGNTVAGRKIQPIFVDDQGKADVGLIKVRQLVENDKVQLLTGVTHTPVCYAVAEYIRQVQVPFVATANCGAQDLTTDARFKSPYLVRLTQVTTQIVDPSADWAYKQGYRKAIVMTGDYGGGIEVSDTFASAFIQRGGAVVQEIHPAVGTSDYGPFLAQLSPDADVMFCFLPGTDGLHLIDQYGGYVGKRKLAIIDGFGAMTSGPNLAQLKQKAAGIVIDNFYSDALDTPMNQAMQKQWAEKYPGRLLTKDAAQGYAAAQVLVDVMKKVDGNVEDKQRFLNALYAADVETIKGRVKLDANHDIVQNIYMSQVVPQGDGVGQKVLETYKDVSQFWDRKPEEVAHFPIGKLKGKWVGTTKAQLGQLMTK